MQLAAQVLLMTNHGEVVEVGAAAGLAQSHVVVRCSVMTPVVPAGHGVVVRVSVVEAGGTHSATQVLTLLRVAPVSDQLDHDV